MKDREEYISILEQDNAELKKQLEKYENPKDMTLMMMWATEKVKDENEKLKKQLEVGEEQYNDLVEEKEKLEEQLSSITLELGEYKKQVNKGLYSTCFPYKTGYDKAVENYTTQQQEFINYITAYIELLNDKPDLVEESQIDILKEILQKYKKIIGVQDESR